jgi:hypothetical protein
MAIFAARFHEARGDVEAARAQYVRLVSDIAPGLLEVRGSNTNVWVERMLACGARGKGRGQSAVV